MSPRDDDRSARQIAKGKRRRAGDRSAKLSNALMKLSLNAVRKVVLDQELRDAVDRARAITSPGARRRAERTLAGELRRYDLVALSERLSRVHESANADTEVFHLAEEWRARLIERGPAALAEFPGGGDAELPRLLDAAQRERTTGRPPGAGKGLFRHIIELLKAQPPIVDAPLAATDDDEAADDENADDENDDDDDEDDDDDAPDPSDA